ncbi:putative ABC transport system permease protein [Micrococcus cohnii]|uniref:Putative ABC transport system permease protein n=1 Tax=Micrococcus cohnii TaxID=993416 RepID=A0A7W7DVX1_9MICC|nr:ABC transporter permease [Micrococcus cohnii]MBB4734578.1 putative ABC transport system permease protein [Micrococcus cohnii]
MRMMDVAGTALSNTWRSKARTLLTVIAIVVGAFTLTLTSGLGAGVNKYVDTVVEGFGAPDELSVSKQSDTPAGGGMMGGAPTEYEEETGGGEMFGTPLLTKKDLEAIEKTKHVTDVETVRMVEPDYIQGEDGTKWQVPFMGSSAEIDMLSLDAGRAPVEDAAEITVPVEWVEPLGGKSAEDVLGQQVTLAASNPLQERDTVTATVVGVTGTAASGSGAGPVPSVSLEQDLHDITTKGLPEQQRNTYFQATVTVEDMEANEQAVKQSLAEQGYQAQTLEEQLGVIRGIIDAVTWVLSGFGLIALLAASFGIINTLLMSVQERTREIGLMKSLGMSSGKVFTLFSMEAVMIGLMGSVVGVGLGLAVGFGANALLVNGALKDVAGLTLFALNPLAILGTIGLILLIAFLAGTLPALRAARKDPISALRYE